MKTLSLNVFSKEKKYEALKTKTRQYGPYPVTNFWWKPQVGTPELTSSKVITLIKEAASEAQNFLQPR